MNIASILATKGINVYTIGPGALIRQALRSLADHNVGALVVVDESQQPVGIISERDIVREAARNERLFSRPVSEIMTKEVILAQPQDDLETVSHAMTEHRIRHLPIVDREALIGIVSIGDILKAQRDQYAGEVDTLQIQMLKETA